jgi:MoxR-like ATPase
MAKGTLFNPARVERPAPTPEGAEATGGDTRDGRVYVYNDARLALAVNVAIAASRPLLLNGPSGSGKSTLAKNVALSLGLRYYEHVVTSRTEATDFLYRFDSLRRLNDAQAKYSQIKPTEMYIEPGVLWWAFDPDSARHRGSKVELTEKDQAKDPSEIQGGGKAVVLIDEIDKAEVDVPNALLVPLGSHRFPVEHLSGRWVTTSQPPLIFITTNGERELPLAFLRRCVSINLRPPGKDELVEIARAHFPKEVNEPLFEEVAAHIVRMGEDERQAAARRPSTAEYLDAVLACLKLGYRPGDPEFNDLANITLSKQHDVEGVDR